MNQSSKGPLVDYYCTRLPAIEQLRVRTSGTKFEKDCRCCYDADELFVDEDFILRSVDDGVEEAGVDIEPDDVYLAKVKVYKQEKAALLAAGYTVEKTRPTGRITTAHWIDCQLGSQGSHQPHGRHHHR